MTDAGSRHLVVVEAYEGLVEHLSDEPAERLSSRGLGLPLAEIAEALGARVTVLTWDDWRQYEATPGSSFRWMPTPVTRPARATAYGELPRFAAERIRSAAIPARDPDHGRPFAVGGVSPRSYGLLANSDVLLLASVCLDLELRALYRSDPFGAVVVPMWGGSGYVAQMARATGVPGAVAVPFVAVVTDTSARRQQSNLEGCWTRPAITRRQMEDVSLALADHALTFGPRGDAIALAGRLPDAPVPVRAPRLVAPEVLERIAAEAGRARDAERPVELFLQEPQQAASGALLALDAVTLLHRRGMLAECAVISAGADMTFAPMKPRTFVGYWSSRGFVRELVAAGRWRWADAYERRDGVYPVRLYPSAFEHLPDVWSELARGTLVLLSPAAAEGLLPDGAPPAAITIDGEPDAERLAARLVDLAATGVRGLDALRRQLCAQVAASHRGAGRRQRLGAAVEVLDRVLRRRVAAADLSQVARMLVDRRTPLRTLVERDAVPAAAPVPATIRPGTLSVVVTCYDMGALLAETVESVWRSERLPDELLLVDDGSEDAATRATIRELEAAARARGMPLTVLRQGNHGLAAARNAGLAAACGELVSFLDGDDLIDPPFYRLACDLLERYPTLGGVAAWALCFGEGRPPGFWNAPQPELPLLLVENTVIVPCVMRTTTLRALGGYDVRQRYNYEDWELAVRMVASGRPIVTIPMYLQRYRMRSDSLFRTMSDVQNQSMRELMLASHGETVARFAVEVAMQLESQLARLVYADRSSSLSQRGGRVQLVLGRTRTALRSAAGRLLRRATRGRSAAR